MKIEKVPKEEREIFRPLINKAAVYDAMASYYACDHEDGQVEVYGAFSGRRNPVGFLVRTRTGMDLFRPLLIPFVARQEVLTDLLDEVLVPSRPVLLMLPVEQWDWINSSIHLSAEKRMDVYRLDPISYQPVMNVLVQSRESPMGWPRYEIRSKSMTVAAAGVNWAGARFVEVYVDLVENARELAFGRSVLAALSENLLSRGRVPIIRLEDDLAYRRVMLEEIGFKRTGVRLVMCQATAAAQEVG